MLLSTWVTAVEAVGDALAIVCDCAGEQKRLMWLT